MVVFFLMMKLVFLVLTSDFSVFLHREMVNLEDDVYSFGFILLEALMGPAVSERGPEHCLKELVGSTL